MKIRSIALRFGIIVILSYSFIVFFMYFMQRNLLYFPSPEVVLPKNVGLSQASVVTLMTNDDERLQGWYIPASHGKPTILFFFGNGSRLHFNIERYRGLTQNGNGLLAISYRGYGASTGYPTEKGLIQDAETAHRFLSNQKIKDNSIVLFADSLGTGVAVALGAKHKFAGIVLDSPFSSTVDVASWRFPFLPISILMKDQFRSSERIKAVKSPLLILHGTADSVVPIMFGKKLYNLANEPKQFIEVPDANHIVSVHPAVLDITIKFIDDLDIK